VNVGAYLARAKKQRVLVVDLDTQGHAGKSLGLDVRGLVPNVFDLLTDPALQVAQVARPTAIDHLSVVPSNKAMSEFPVAVAAQADRALKLDQKVRGLQGYDFVLYDAPPSMGLTTTNIMAAADEVVIPVALTYFALDGCAEILESMRKVAAEHGKPELRVSLVVPTLYRKTALAEEILAKLKGYFPQELSRTALGYNVKIDEAQSHGQTIWEYAPKSKGAEMLKSIADELPNRGGHHEALVRAGCAAGHRRLRWGQRRDVHPVQDLPQGRQHVLVLQAQLERGRHLPLQAERRHLGAVCGQPLQHLRGGEGQPVVREPLKTAGTGYQVLGTGTTSTQYPVPSAQSLPSSVRLE
jgi:chromosome partitioning protein